MKVLVTDKHIEVLKENNILLSLSGAYEKSWLDKLKGKAITIPKNAVAEEYSCYCVPGFFSMGVYSYSKSGFVKNVEVGRYCSIAAGVTILPANHPMDRLSTSGMDYSTNALHHSAFKRVKVKREPFSLKIGHDVWISPDTILKPGITIGNGAVIGIRSIVTKDVPPYAIVAGSPAVIKGYRFPEDIIERLLKSEWYNCHPESLAQFSTVNVEEFLEGFESKKDSLRELSFNKHNLLELLTNA